MLRRCVQSPIGRAHFRTGASTQHPLAWFGSEAPASRIEVKPSLSAHQRRVLCLQPFEHGPEGIPSSLDETCDDTHGVLKGLGGRGMWGTHGLHGTILTRQAWRRHPEPRPSLARPCKAMPGATVCPTWAALTN